jgi:hypothetical protein
MRDEKISRAPQVVGAVERILFSPVAGQLPWSIERIQAVAGAGLQGDRYFARVGTWSDHRIQTGKDLTLIEAEVLEEIGLAGPEARRNIVTRGVRLTDLVGSRFRIGEVECYGDRVCEPCSHLARLTGVSIEALVHRGGLRADILSDGQIRAADLLTRDASTETSRPRFGSRLTRRGR